MLAALLCLFLFTYSFKPLFILSSTADAAACCCCWLCACVVIFINLFALGPMKIVNSAFGWLDACVAAAVVVAVAALILRVLKFFFFYLFSVFCFVLSAATLHGLLLDLNIFLLLPTSLLLRGFWSLRRLADFFLLVCGICA